MKEFTSDDIWPLDACMRVPHQAATAKGLRLQGQPS